MTTATDDRGPQLEAVAITFLVLATTSFALRTYARLFIVRAFGPDDYLMAAAAASFILFVVCALVGIHYGTGRHMVDLEVPARQRAMQYWFLCYVWYCWTMIFSKLSIGLFLLRIVASRLHARIAYFAMGLGVLIGLVFFFATLLQCQPVSYFWNEDQSGHCIPMDVLVFLTFLYSALNIICDFTFALLPMVIVTGLNMNKKTKVALAPLLSMGCIASGAVVVRLAYIERFRDPDFLYATVDIAIWSTVEQGLAVAAGSLACTRPLFRGVARHLGWSSPTGPSSNRGPIPATIGSAEGPHRMNVLGRRSAVMFTLMGDEDGQQFNDAASSTTLVTKLERGFMTQKGSSDAMGAV